jgi:uncharacterized membrane protein YqjE
VAQRVQIDPDKGLTDLVRELGDDSRQLLSAEMRLAKAESAEALRRVGRGALWLGVAFGTVVVALVAFTLFLATAVGGFAGGHMWIGAITAAVVELAVGSWLVMRGLRDYKRPAYSLPETRDGLRMLKGS